jgi:hypothetical protein
MRRILATAAATALALTTLAVPASAQATATVCDPNSGQVHLNVYQRDNKFIDAKGGFFGCSYSVDFTILVQLKNVIGWSDKVVRTGTWSHDTLVTTTFTCTGQGTKTYRAQMYGTNNHGDRWVRNSSEIKVKC